MTIPTADTTLFKEEREQTNESLTTERGKTDQSLEVSQKKAENKADQKVKNARTESDETRTQERLDSDNNKTHTNSHRVQEERNYEDDNVKKERKLVDAVIRDERDQHKVLMNLSLSKEREETDQSLSFERETVDQQVLKATASHTETKTELTTRDEFLAIVSHDLRNPIGAIVSGSTHLLEDPSFENSEEMKYWLAFIKRNAESSLRLISDLLDMERFAVGKLELAKDVFNLNELLNEVVTNFTHLAVEKRIQVTLKDLPPTKVHADRDRISQVISNLLSNALKFTENDGSVTLEIKNTKEGIRTSVSDTGPGIAEEQKAKIFERFAQIKNADRRGLGLGLYISKMLVEAHKGQIGVVSTQGEGSTFSFTLPG